MKTVWKMRTTLGYYFFKDLVSFQKVFTWSTCTIFVFALFLLNILWSTKNIKIFVKGQYCGVFTSYYLLPIIWQSKMYPDNYFFNFPAGILYFDMERKVLMVQSSILDESFHLERNLKLNFVQWGHISYCNLFRLWWEGNQLYLKVLITLDDQPPTHTHTHWALEHRE